MHDDEADLLARVALGDHQALRALYDAYRPRLRAFLWRLLDGDGAAVEDCLQETFITVWRAASTYRGEGRVAAWLFRIASRAASHARRALERHPAEPFAVGSGEPATDEEPDVVDRLTLAAALADLPPKHRAALELVFVYGCSVAETATILAIPAGTVKSRLNHARKLLARALATAEQGEHP